MSLDIDLTWLDMLLVRNLGSPKTRKTLKKALVCTN
jgi:hypothetical protein